LRFGWIVVCFVPMLLAIGLWVRSYRWSDLVHGSAQNSPMEIISSEGRLKITRVQRLPGILKQYDGWRCFEDSRSEAQTMAQHVRSFRTWAGIGIVPLPHRAVLAPYWLVMLMAGGVGIALTRVQ
jgi:hypothetical protein